MATVKQCDLCKGTPAFTVHIQPEDRPGWEVDACNACAKKCFAEPKTSHGTFVKVPVPPQPQN